MRPEELKQTLAKMIKDTEAGKLKWRVNVQTTEGREDKYVVQEGDRAWIVDECYVSYDCAYRGEEFSMITYEMLKSCGAEVRTVNYIFLPPRGVRLFSLHTLLKYSVDADAVLIDRARALWEVLARLSKEGSGQVNLKVTEADVSIEEDW